MKRFLTLCMVLFLLTNALSCILTMADNNWELGAFNFKEYLNAMYFIYQTATVVGYGDVPMGLQNQSYFELRMILELGVMFFAILACGYIFSCVGQSVREMSTSKRIQVQEVSQLSPSLTSVRSGWMDVSPATMATSATSTIAR